MVAMEEFLGSLLKVRGQGGRLGERERERVE